MAKGTKETHPNDVQRKLTLGPTTGMAAERTLLAWVRTGLALMGFGFVVARFGLFLRELASAEHLPPHPSTGLSSWFGGGLMLLGVLVLIAAGVNHLRLMRRLASGGTYQVSNVPIGVVLTFLLAVVGAVMTGYLVISTR